MATKATSSENFGPHTILADRLRWARKQAGFEKVDVARETKLSLSYVGQLENGKYKNPSRAALMSLAKLFAVSFHWLETGQGQAVRAPVSEMEPAPTRESQPGMKPASGEQGVLGMPSDHPLTKAIFKLKEVFDKHGPESEEWKWICGNIEVFGRVPPRRAAPTERVVSSRGGVSGKMR